MAGWMVTFWASSSVGVDADASVAAGADAIFAILDGVGDLTSV